MCAVGAESVASTPSRGDLDTRVPADRCPANSPVESLRDALQADDGQVAAPFIPLRLQLDLDSRLPADERLRLRARRSSRPLLPRLDSRLPVDGRCHDLGVTGCLPVAHGSTVLSANDAVPAKQIVIPLSLLTRFGFEVSSFWGAGGLACAGETAGPAGFGAFACPLSVGAGGLGGGLMADWAAEKWVDPYFESTIDPYFDKRVEDSGR